MKWANNEAYMPLLPGDTIDTEKEVSPSKSRLEFQNRKRDKDSHRWRKDTNASRNSFLSPSGFVHWKVVYRDVYREMTERLTMLLPPSLASFVLSYKFDNNSTNSAKFDFGAKSKKKFNIPPSKLCQTIEDEETLNQDNIEVWRLKRKQDKEKKPRRLFQ